MFVANFWSTTLSSVIAGTVASVASLFFVWLFRNHIYKWIVTRHNQKLKKEILNEFFTGFKNPRHLEKNLSKMFKNYKSTASDINFPFNWSLEEMFGKVNQTIQAGENINYSELNQGARIFLKDFFNFYISRLGEGGSLEDTDNKLYREYIKFKKVTRYK